MKYDFVAIGDVVTDAFIRLYPDSATTTDGEHPKLCLGYGDKIPFEKAYVIPGVGNSANAAVAASRLGIKTALVSHVGDDHFGKEIIDTLFRAGVETSMITTNSGRSSNYHYVLWYKDDRTILIKQEDFAYHLPAEIDGAWFYFSSVGEHAIDFHDELAQYIAAHPEIHLAFQPGTFQIKLGTERLRLIYAHTSLFFCNKEEAEIILKTGNADIELLARGIRALGPKIVVITDGKKGAYIYEENRLWFMPVYPDPKPPYERTGAGDAYASTFAAVLALGLSIQDAMRWAPINSMSVVQYVGAQEGLLARDALEKFLSEAPKEYTPVLLKEL